MKIIFLGTGCSNPTKDRNLSSIALRFNGEWFLFDCAEGTQRQMIRAKVSYMKIQNIFLSHFHADHVLGLPGLFATMALHGRDYPVKVYGPKGVKEFVEKSINLIGLKPNFEIKCVEAKNGVILNGNGFEVSSFPLKHEVPTRGYVFREEGKAGKFSRETALKLEIPEGPLWSKLQKGESVKVGNKRFKPEQVMDYSKGRKGKMIAVVMDTVVSESYLEEISGADILIHESSFTEKMKSRAVETKHSMVKDVARLAERAGAGKLYLTHISPRHKETEKMENEARMVFAQSYAAKDLMEIEL
ncbi:MAG: ribonuclease Z [Candidatus Diapherotrites archaeon]